MKMIKYLLKEKKMISNIFIPKGHLSNSEKKVQKYIQNSPNRIETLTINKLAVTVGTSVASVQRYCQKIGFSGYKEFKFAFLNALAKQAENQKKENANQLCLDYLNGYQKILEKLKAIKQKQIDKLANALLNNRFNYILGIYYSSVPARLLTLQLQDLGLPTFCAVNDINGEHLLDNADNDATIVLFSINGVKEHYEDYWGDSISNCNNSFLITMNKKAEFSRFFKNTIVLPGNNLEENLSFDQQSVPTIFIEMLMQVIHHKNLQKIS